MKAPASARRPSLWAGLVLAAVTVGVCLVAAELALRLRTSASLLWHFPNFIQLDLQSDESERPQLRYDRELGWDLQPGASGLLAGKPISISADGMRNHTPGVRVGSGPTILAFGDSYTEGYAVADDETWPAHLEWLTGRRVLAGGVRDYGLDQMILKAERLVPTLKPGTVVLAFIASDIDRAGREARSLRSKPYFVTTQAGLELRNVPVPTAPLPGPNTLVRRVLGHSYLLHFIMNRLELHDLWHGDTVETGEDSDLVSCRLMARFAALVQREKVDALVVAFRRYEDWAWPANGGIQDRRVAAVLGCASAAGLKTLNTSEAFEKNGVARDPEAFFTEWHFNDRANALAAQLIASAL
jgi:hypothetical protein